MALATVIYSGEYPRLMDGLNTVFTSLPPGISDVIDIPELEAVRVSVDYREDRERVLSLSTFYKNIVGVLWH